ncbi:phosphatase PAP2 family protein [Inediibacterium massiliense]|uniref:phosphatase PAP2 family protein n=1 Tax=Inediibacterium massiliense TaxID=1658111 RepID=UPI0006B554A7|nr:phosphatase PAP2 family protein [Inediibacterium massiliense]
MNWIQEFDMNVLHNIHYYTQNHIFDKIMPWITFLGDKGLVWIIFCILLLLSKKYRKVGCLALCALVISSVLGEGIFKHLFKRPRPFLQLPNLQLLISKPTTYSFPSGHTSSSFAVAGVLFNKLKRFRKTILFIAFLIAFSRLYLFVHYPSDVLAGVVLGVGSAMFVINLDHKKVLFGKNY